MIEILINFFIFDFRMSGTISKKEEKKYFQLSPDTVPLLAETVGINGNSVSPSVSRALAEDDSYRCRELANVSDSLVCP